ncbi:cupin domain-containing protein [Paraburkholderia susongensis]|uniref:Cupin 2 domain-containing protein n=1 Tax=Paraburkholderia susongensis TaxID=1515439 RepID=A0A1X7IBD1_9BURK|nr:cupin domain-containing protein [Paraburkholderia susongensis]SMG11394.1 cupin 2 domain-containing protein [Paraburkholderia susongensis]
MTRAPKPAPKPARASGNLFAPVAAVASAAASESGSESGEHFDTLVEQRGVTIERIVSTGQASPPGFWYDSPRAEWVVLLAGAAVLEFEGDTAPHPMNPGDHVLIEAHCRHRVAWTSDTEPSVWLAVHYPGVPAA